MASDLSPPLRPFGWDDLDRLVVLMKACQQEDRTAEVVHPETVRTMFTLPGREPENSVRILENAAGELVALCTAWPTPGIHADTVQIGVRIRPDRRDPGLYASLLQATEEMARHAHVPSGRPAELHAGAHPQPELWREAVEAAGYQPVRWFIDMIRPLAGKPPRPEAPAGIQIRFLNDGIEPLSLKRALDEAFMDHWKPPDFTDEQFLHWTSSPLFRPGLTAVALDAKGAVAGGAVGAIRDSGAPSGEREARIEVLGVRKAYRGTGVGRALLLSCFQRMQSAGMDSVSLDVDADNPTGATGLYRSVGLEERDRVTVYAKPLD